MLRTRRDIASVIDDFAEGSMTQVRTRDESYTGFGLRSISDWTAEMTRRSLTVSRAVIGVDVFPYGTTTRSTRHSFVVVARTGEQVIPVIRAVNNIATNMRNDDVRMYCNLGMQTSDFWSEMHDLRTSVHPSLALATRQT